MKKFILLALILSLAAAPVLSCVSDEPESNGANQNVPENAGEPVTGPDGTNEEPGGETSPELTFPDLPDVDFGGYEFRIWNTGAGVQAWIMTQLLAEEETGQALNDSIFRRNRRIEERFGFTLVQRDFQGAGFVRDAARPSIAAGADDFDLAMINPMYAVIMAQDGHIVMLDTLPHIDLSQPWWDQDMIRDFSIGGRVFFATGDFSFNHYSVTIGTLFNKQIHADLGLDCPYTLVHEGRWTLERFAEMGRAGLVDLNGDGIFDRNDQWGLAATTANYTQAIMNGLGARYITKDANDIPVLNLNTQGFIERFQTAFDVLTEGWVFDYSRPNTGETAFNMFSTNRALFWINPIHRAVDLRAMDNDFGILPQPKLNEQQPYHISATVVPHVKTIPVTAPDLERTGIILEALNAESRMTTLHIYYDIMLVNQVMNRDEESAGMLEIMFSNRVYELGRLYWNTQVADPIQHAMRDFNREIVSVIEAREAAAVAAIDAAISTFLED